MTGRAWLLLLLLVAAIAAAALAAPRLEGTPPGIDVPDVHVLGRAPLALQIELSDEGTGLRSAVVRLVHAGGETTLVERAFPGGLLAGGAAGSRTASLELTLDPASLGLSDGDVQLVITARDWSWRDGLAGNGAERTMPLRVDTRPPKVRVETGLTWVRRGGAGVVVYEVDEDGESGVRVADTFFPGVPAAQGDEGRRVALYAVPVEAPPEPTLRVVARDAAGNETEVRWPARVVERGFPETTIRLSSQFLSNVAQPLAQANGVGSADPVEAFRHVNEDLRARSEARIREILREPSQDRLFDGPFEQLANSKVTSGFAEHRSYRIDDRTVSEARHYGFDLAATAATPVTAAAAGVVRHAGDLGIYGNTVLLDHGLGLATLYAHLSQVDVEPGQRVAKGETLGLSGATGLAGGDHLHFAVLIGGTYVDPLEWWDARWVKEHVEAVLARSSPYASR
jgi:murein DD-endopeptidase MepM/ murein hydrolase activator NlpD